MIWGCSVDKLVPREVRLYPERASDTRSSSWMSNQDPAQVMLWRCHTRGGVIHSTAASRDRSSRQGLAGRASEQANTLAHTSTHCRQCWLIHTLMSFSRHQAVNYSCHQLLALLWWLRWGGAAVGGVLWYHLLPLPAQV